MLSDQEKKEMLSDARNLMRRRNFAVGKNFLRDRGTRLFVDYFQFLKDIQQLAPINNVPTKTSTKYNKL